MNRLAFLLCLLAFPASAQQCGSYDEIKTQLAEKYGERAMMVGNIGQENAPVTAYFWVNRETRTFTLVGVMESGRACIITAGDNLRPAPRSEEDAKPEQKS